MNGNSEANPVQTQATGWTSSPEKQAKFEDTKPDVGIVVGKEWLKQCNRVPNTHGRASLTMCLIKSFGLLNKAKIIDAKQATREDLETFHSKEYLDHCDKTASNDDLEKLEYEAKENQESFGLEYDCPLIPDLNEFIGWVAGGSLAAAEALNSKFCKQAINWGGGWHHSQRDEASGFCYVNDIVLAIQRLRKVYDRVLYIDLDVHHGDGVENAFCFSNKVFTLSLHKYSPGFFPGTGSIKDVGNGKGKFYSLNIPLKDGINDEDYYYVFKSVFAEISYAFKPDAVVVQCGADALACDPLGGFNLTPDGMGKCLERILQLNVPTMFLGGGGYNLTNAARCWAYLTGVILGVKLPEDIPDCDPFFEKYGPSFELAVTPGRRKNTNTKEELDDLLEEAFELLDEVA